MKLRPGGMMRNELVTRRRFLGGAACAVPAGYLAVRGGWAWGQEGAVPALVMQARAGAANARVTGKVLRGNVGVLMGSGGNIGVMTGKDGKLVVDSGYSTSRPQVMEALATMGAEPVTMLVNTHWHFDHTDGNEWMHGAGAKIVAHENTRKHLSEPTMIAAFKTTFPAAPKGALPAEVFAEMKTLRHNGARVELVHYAPAHTDSDLSVHFTEADVLHVGDTWFNGFYPFIDYSTGGSIDGMIAATKRNIATAGTATIVIPGHGPIGDKAGLTEFGEMLMGVRENVAALKKQGKTLEETVAAGPTSAFDEKWGKGMMNAGAFIGLVYQGV